MLDLGQCKQLESEGYILPGPYIAVDAFLHQDALPALLQFVGKNQYECFCCEEISRTDGVTVSKMLADIQIMSFGETKRVLAWV